MEGEAAALLFELLKTELDNYRKERREQSRLMRDASKHVEQLEEDVSVLIKFLKDSITKRSKNEILNMSKLLRDVRSSIYDAEDTLDSLLIHAAGKASTRSKLAKIVQLAGSRCAEVKQIRDKVDERSKVDTRNDGRLVEYAPTPGEPEVVGFGNEMQQLKDGLSQHTLQVDVIIVTGAHGVGKTTLAAKIFHDQQIREKFDMLPMWVNLSECSTKNIFLAILSQLDELPQDASQKTTSHLSASVADCFRGRTFLIVIDGMPQVHDPRVLLSAFEGSHGNSKVMITTTNIEVARLVGQHSHSVEVPVQPLVPQESFDLLKRLVFPSKTVFPSEFEADGESIANGCRGLPFAIVEVAGVVAKKMSQYCDLEERIKIWDNVSRSMDRFFTTMPGNPIVLSIYDTLDYNLRSCFLYMGIYRQHHKFSVSELTRMWIAEGFIPPTDDLNLSLEQTAQKYLEQLIGANLVK